MRKAKANHVRFAMAAFGAACAAASGVAFAQQPDAQALQAQDADIRAFIADVARQTRRTIIVDPRVQGTVTLFSDRTLSNGELFEVFLAALRANQLIAVPIAGGGYLVQPEEGVATEPSTAGNARPFITDVIRLNQIDATTIAESLRPFIGRRGVILPSARSNLIVIADYADNVKRLRGLIAELDIDRSQTRTIALANAGAREIAGVVEGLLDVESAERAGRPPEVRLVPVESSNAILVRGEAAAVDKYARLIEDLDARAQSSSDIRVVRLNYAQAETILPVLQELVSGGQPGGGPVVPGQANAAANAASGAITGAVGRARITAFREANALVIAADPETQRVLAEVIRKLDVRRAQVVVEAIIAEVSDDAARQLGLQFLLSGRDGSGVPFATTNFSTNAPNLLALSGALIDGGIFGEESDTTSLLQDAAVASLLGATGGIAGFGGQIGDDALFGLVLNAVQTDSKSNLLSVPSITVLDNEEGSFVVGEDVPISTGQVLSNDNSNPFLTIQRREVGVKLTVRPQINSDGGVSLRIEQEVSAVSGPVNIGVPDLTFSTREVSTSVLVDDGEILVISGLLDQAETDTVNKVPLLGDIPVLGRLFRDEGRSRVKTNLMIFLRPRIIRNAEDARAVTTPRYKSIRDAQIDLDQGRSTLIEDVIRDYLGVEPPGETAPPLRNPPQARDGLRYDGEPPNERPAAPAGDPPPSPAPAAFSPISPETLTPIPARFDGAPDWRRPIAPSRARFAFDRPIAPTPRRLGPPE